MCKREEEEEEEEEGKEDAAAWLSFSLSFSPSGPFFLLLRTYTLFLLSSRSESAENGRRTAVGRTDEERAEERRRPPFLPVFSDSASVCCSRKRYTRRHGSGKGQRALLPPSSRFLWRRSWRVRDSNTWLLFKRGRAGRGREERFFYASLFVKV